MNNLCPECRKRLAINAKRCTCGWLSPTLIPTRTKAPPPCQYRLNGRHCPLPGTNCPYPYATNGPWFCAWHLRSHSQPALAEADLHYIEKNYHQIMEERRPWQDRLMESLLARQEKGEKK